MEPLALSAFTLTSALGYGLDAHLEALVAGRSGLRPCNFAGLQLDTWIGKVEGIENERVESPLQQFASRNNCLAQAALRQDGFLASVNAAARRYGRHRVAVVLGTTTAGILSGEEAFAHRDRESDGLPATFHHQGTVDHHSLADFVSRQLGLAGPCFTISTACSSSAKVFGDAWELLQAGFCDAAVVGGADSLCRMTLRGFASLELLSPQPCRPNDANRRGISIGEAAGFALLEFADAAPQDAVRLLGYGNSCDAHHMSAPDPNGEGAALAMSAALEAAGLASSTIDWVHQHGTGTVANDRAEDAAVSSVLGTQVPCSSTKGWTGHTLGAAGIVNAVLSALCLREGWLPGNLNLAVVDPALRCRILTGSQRIPLYRVLTNAFGFGGSNCSLVLGREG